MSQPKPRIAVTMGDPAGVGPEICLRLLAEETIAEMWTPIVFGDADILHRVAEATDLAPPDRIIGRADWPHLHAEVDAPTVLDLRPPGASQIEPATVSVDAGRAAWTFIKAAIDSALAGEVDAVTTAPINKLSLSKAGVPFPGHTEIFAHHTNAERHCMMQYSDEVTASFVTCHVGLRDVPDLITEERVFETIDPAIERARSAGIDIEGPLPPDTAFLPVRRKTTGCTVCMYHDQGHIPLKALAFDRAVNITLGLPIVRTSVDHGTAFDIAWEGIADPGSLFEAVRLAAQFGANRSAETPV